MCFKAYLWSPMCDGILVTSRLDYGNGLLWGIRANHISKLRGVYNSAVRIIVQARKFYQFTDILEELHWLGVAQRI